MNAMQQSLFSSCRLSLCLLLVVVTGQHSSAVDDATITSGPSLALSSSWGINLSKGDTKTKDVFDVIGVSGRKTVNLAPVSIALDAGITYLMPLNDALKLLGKTVSSKKSVACPGFPAGSLRYYSFDGNYADRCNKLHLVTDLNDQVVGMEYVDESPAKGRLARHTTGYNVYNFIETKAKASANWRIAHRRTQQGNLLVVQSELLDSEGRAREYVRLLLAMPVVDVISLTSDEGAMQVYRQQQLEGAKQPPQVATQLATRVTEQGQAQEMKQVQRQDEQPVQKVAPAPPAETPWIVGTTWYWRGDHKSRIVQYLEFKADGVAIIKYRSGDVIGHPRWEIKSDGTIEMIGVDTYTLTPDKDHSVMTMVQRTGDPGASRQLKIVR